MCLRAFSFKLAKCPCPSAALSARNFFVPGLIWATLEVDTTKCQAQERKFVLMPLKLKCTVVDVFLHLTTGEVISSISHTPHCRSKIRALRLGFVGHEWVTGRGIILIVRQQQTIQKAVLFFIREDSTPNAQAVLLTLMVNFHKTGTSSHRACRDVVV